MRHCANSNGVTTPSSVPHPPTEPPANRQSAAVMAREAFVKKPFTAEGLIAATRRMLDASV